MPFNLAEVQRTVSNISRWAGRPEWVEDLSALMDAHAGEGFDRYGIDFHLLRAKDRDIAQMLLNAVMDDMCSHVVMTEDEDDDGRNLIEDYLKRGYREKPGSIAYLQALQMTPCTVVEVLAVEPGKWAEVSDLVAGGPSIRVPEKSGTKDLQPGRFIATKLLDLKGEMHFSGSLLPLTRHQADAILEEYRSSMRELETFLAGAVEVVGEKAAATREVMETGIRISLAPLATHVWLTGALINLYGSPPEETGENDLSAAPAGAELPPVKVTDADYLAMLDEPSEVFGGRTPREMSRSKKKKHREEAMLFLISIEMAETLSRKASGKPPYDAAWLWKELELKDPRQK